MNRVLRFLFFALVVRPVVTIVLGLNVRNREQLPADGPAVLVANHNSHLDTLVLMVLFPWRMLPRLRPVAAADYFFRNRFWKWFSLNIIGIIPLDRDARRSDNRRHPMAPISDSLGQGDIVILFPEGSRGDPERLGEFQTGVAHLAKLHPDVPFYPIYLHGLGKALPKGERLLVPFFCDVFVGGPLRYDGDKAAFMATMVERINTLAAEGHFEPWE
ncbi:MAG: 1-acyl-sn-glycerol-3-phosphate acyltransferase [Planctomycetaceae bacterium]|nr:1-acyl-sn-glycerol-3-phosphate acyltransferase [Planctomycetaceae bacterium]